MLRNPLFVAAVGLVICLPALVAGLGASHTAGIVIGVVLVAAGAVIALRGGGDR